MSGGIPVRELDYSKKITAAGVKLLRFVCPEEGFVTCQGCCFDGENWVVAFNRFDESGEEKTLLCKYDPKGDLVKTSNGVLSLEHANNITYLPERAAYYVTSCHGTVRECWNGYSVVDRDSLEVLEKGNLPKPFFAMGYCPERKAYASGEWAGQVLDFWDEDRILTLSKDVVQPKTLSQGVFADKEHVWFVRSTQNGAHQEFRVYDWDGKLSACIPLDLENDVESESVNFIDDTVYVTSNGGWYSDLFRIDFFQE